MRGSLRPLAEYRKSVLGTWFDWKIFRRDRRLILQNPRRAGRIDRPIKNGPFQFATQALIPTLVLAWIVETGVVVVGGLPPSRYERFMEWYRETATQMESSGELDLATADSMLAALPPRLAELDTAGLRRKADALDARISAIKAAIPEDVADKAQDLLQRPPSDSFRDAGRASGDQDAIRAWRDSLDQAISDLHSGARLFEIANRMMDTLIQVQQAHIALVRREGGLVQLQAGENYRRAERRRLAAERATALVGRFSEILAISAVLLSAVLFGLAFQRFFPRADRDAASLYLYSVGATLVWPNVAFLLWAVLSDLGDRLQYEWAMWPAAIGYGLVVAWAFSALWRAAHIVREVVLDRDPSANASRTQVVVMGIFVCSQVSTGLAIGLLTRAISFAYYISLA